MKEIFKRNILIPVTLVAAVALGMIALYYWREMDGNIIGILLEAMLIIGLLALLRFFIIDSIRYDLIEYKKMKENLEWESAIRHIRNNNPSITDEDSARLLKEAKELFTQADEKKIEKIASTKKIEQRAKFIGEIYKK